MPDGLADPLTSPPPVHHVSVVIPVYRGEKHLVGIVKELATLREPRESAGGHLFRVAEAVLVHDCGPDDSARVIRELAAEHTWVRPVWLSRNYGQHPATLAGMSSSSSEWIVTMDEDGQHDPSDVGNLLDAALSERASLVYARPVNAAPHALFRRITSTASKRVINLLSSGVDASAFHSYRLVLGEVGRSVAAYAGAGVYLDVALSWVAGKPATAPVTLRDEGERQSGYNARTLLSHFWRMVLTSGTRGLRVLSLVGALSALVGFALALWLIADRVVSDSIPAGWTSMMVVTLLGVGVTLFFLGVIAEYLGVAVNMAMGKPLYLITGDPASGPLGRRTHDRTE